jgi:alpha-L-fucosidase
VGALSATAHAQPKTAPKLVPHDPFVNETPAQHDARMKWWREAKFGLFIHWGLFSEAGGIWKGKEAGPRGINTQGYGEWMMHNERIPVADYATLAPKFNPTLFDADKWASYAKAAGMKYVVLTSKHHEGFAMYPSAASKFNLRDATPFKRDAIAELKAACQKQGLKFGLYFSQNLDWTHPGGGPSGERWDKAQEGDFDAYVRNIAAPQAREVITRYKPDVLWWDIPANFTPEQVRLLTAAFSSVPKLITNDRLGGGVRGDTGTPEQYIPATGFPGRDWEVCMTMNGTWGFKFNDQNYKSSESLTRNLIDIVSKGGNYLLNVGPDGRGVVPAPEVQRLQQIGAWMKKNGASIYGTTASPYKRLGFDGRATVKGNTLYLNVFEWPANGLQLAGLKTAVRSARVLATGEKLQVLASNGTLRIAKPRALDAVSTAIALTLAGPPQVLEPEIVALTRTNGSFKLVASDAVLQGETLQVQDGGDKANIGYWTNASDSVSWKLKAPAAGEFKVALDYSCEPGSEGSTFALEVDGRDSGLRGVVAKTDGWNDFRTITLDGALSLSAGTHTLRIKPLSKPGLAVMNLQSIALSPAR